MSRLSIQYTEQTGRLLYLAHRINATILEAVISMLTVGYYHRKDSDHLHRQKIMKKILSFIEDNVSYHHVLQKPAASKLETNMGLAIVGLLAMSNRRLALLVIRNRKSRTRQRGRKFRFKSDWRNQ